jgi:hypothetical protein
LGIYGNHNESLGDFSINLYGNQRYNGPPNLVTLTGVDFVRRFGFRPGTKAKAARRALVLDLVRLWREPASPIEPVRLRGLRELGLVDPGGRPTLPILSAIDERKLSEMAAAFAPAMLAILERHRRSLDARYRASPYAREGVSFAEFFTLAVSYFLNSRNRSARRRPADSDAARQYHHLFVGSLGKSPILFTKSAYRQECSSEHDGTLRR